MEIEVYKPIANDTLIDLSFRNAYIKQVSELEIRLEIEGRIFSIKPILDCINNLRLEVCEVVVADVLAT